MAGLLTSEGCLTRPCSRVRTMPPQVLGAGLALSDRNAATPEEGVRVRLGLGLTPPALDSPTRVTLGRSGGSTP